MTTETFTKAEIAEAVNRPLRTIQFWTDKGVIVPDVRGPKGKGVARLYSKANLIEFKMAHILNNDYGLHLTLIEVLFRMIRGGKTPITRDDFLGSAKGQSLIAFIENAPKFIGDRYWWEKHEPLSIWFCLAEDVIQLSKDALAHGALTVVDLGMVRDLAIGQ